MVLISITSSCRNSASNPVLTVYPDRTGCARNPIGIKENGVRSRLSINSILASLQRGSFAHWQRIARLDGRYLKTQVMFSPGTIDVSNLTAEQGRLWQPFHDPVDQAQMQVRVVIKKIGRMAFARQDPDFRSLTAFPDRRKQPGKEWQLDFGAYK